LVRETQRDRRFASRAAEGVGRVLAFKKNKQELRRWANAPTAELVERLSRRLWEFNEQVRLGGL
jgi:hypothetical protein